jgi:hypothetical protein
MSDEFRHKCLLATENGGVAAVRAVYDQNQHDQYLDEASNNIEINFYLLLCVSKLQQLGLLMVGRSLCRGQSFLQHRLTVEQYDDP